jgi:Na+/H+ antiporter NhaD/arsenite permease-like protein
MLELLGEQAGSHSQAAPAVMIVFALGMLATYAGIALDRFHKTVVALLGAGLLTLLALALGLFEYPAIYEFLKKDLNVFGVIIGTGILVDVTGKSGLFHFLSMQIVRVTDGQAARLFLAICGLTFAFVAVLTIVPAMLIVSSLVLVICRNLDYDPKPFLIGAALCANSGAIVTFASGLPNIMIGTSAGIPYVHFLMVSAPYAVVSLLIALGMLRLLYRRELPWKQSADEQRALHARIAEFDPWALVESRRVLLRSAAILSATVLGFAFAQVLGLGMDFIAMSGGTAALLFAGKGVEDAIAKVNWPVILFFMALFLLIGCVESTGALDWTARQVTALSQGSMPALIVLLTLFAAFASAIVDNIPVAATLIPIVQNISASSPLIAQEPLWWSLVIGCNLGGNGTPIGSISCVIALYTLKKEAHINVGWGEFIRIGGTLLVLQLAGAVVYLLVLNALGAFPPLP